MRCSFSRIPPPIVSCDTLEYAPKVCAAAPQVLLLPSIHSSSYHKNTHTAFVGVDPHFLTPSPFLTPDPSPFSPARPPPRPLLPLCLCLPLSFVRMCAP